MIGYLESCNKKTISKAGKLSCWALPSEKIVSTHVIKLDLSEDIYVHFIFYVNLIEPAATDPPHLSHIQLLLPSIEVGSKTKLKIEAIIDLQYFGRVKKLHYHVR